MVIMTIYGAAIQSCSGAWAWLIIILVIVSCTSLSLCFLHLFSNFIQLVSVLFTPVQLCTMLKFCRKTSQEHVNIATSDYSLMGGAIKAYSSHCVCVCVCVCESFCEIFVCIPLRSLKSKDWNVQSKLNAVLSWKRIGKFWIKYFIVELWCDFLTFTACRKVSSPRQTAFQLPQYHLYHKAVSISSEILRTSMSKLHNHLSN